MKHKDRKQQAETVDPRSIQLRVEPRGFLSHGSCLVASCEGRQTWFVSGGLCIETTGCL